MSRLIPIGTKSELDAEPRWQAGAGGLLLVAFTVEM